MEGVLYEVEPKNNDDWYWMYAAAVITGKAAEGQNDVVDYGRHRLLVISIDQMRDHFFQMLGPRVFHHWRDRHQAGFSFRYFLDHLEPHIARPAPYSSRMQLLSAEGHTAVAVPYQRGEGMMWLLAEELAV
jgi:hypothetical protein